MLFLSEEEKWAHLGLIRVKWKGVIGGGHDEANE